MKSKLRREYESRFGDADDALKLYDDKGNMIYCEYSKGLWTKYEYDDNNNVVYAESSYGLWSKREFDVNNNEIYAESSREGVIFDNRSCSDKVFIDEQSGKKFKMTEVK